jgi:hypothetical protein
MPKGIGEAFFDEYKRKLKEYWFEEPIMYPFFCTIFVVTLFRNKN